MANVESLVLNMGIIDLSSYMLKSVYDANNDGVVDLSTSTNHIDWSNVASKPTTISGYGITNAYTKAEVDALTSNKEDKTKLTFVAASTTTPASTVAKVATTVGGSYVPAVGDIIQLTLSQSNTGSNPTLNIDGSGAKNILCGNVAPSNIAFSGTKVMLFYDGTAYQLFGSQRVSDTDTNTTYSATGITPVTIAGTTQTAVINTLYIPNNAAQVNITLPASAIVGSVVEVNGLGAGGWKLTAPSGCNIRIEGATTGPAGYISGLQYATVVVRCIVANTTWEVTAYTGVLTDNNSNTYGGGGGSGSVTSVAMSVPTGLSVSGSPITTSGTLAVSYAGGYQGYTASEATKLSGIEALADVTDATNVASAGAFMKSVDDTDDITEGATKKFATSAEKTKLSNITVTQAVDLDAMEAFTSSITATASELNILDGATLTTTELNYVDGVTSNIQTQLNAKANDADVVKLTGDQTVAGTKTFSASPVVPSKTTDAGNNGTSIATETQVYNIDAGRYDAGTSGTAKTIDWANGRRQYVSLTGNVLFTLSNPVAGRTYLLELIQDGTGGRTVTRPGSVEGTMSIDSAINAKTIVTMYYDGTKYHLPEGGGGGGGSTGGSFKFALAGTIGATGTNVANTVMATGTKTITSCHLWYGTAGNGTLTIDVNKNGTSIFSTNPTITTTNQKTVNAGTISSGGVVAGDMLTLDIDGVPGTTKGVDLFVELVYS